MRLARAIVVHRPHGAPDHQIKGLHYPLARCGPERAREMAPSSHKATVRPHIPQSRTSSKGSPSGRPTYILPRIPHLHLRHQRNISTRWVVLMPRRSNCASECPDPSSPRDHVLGAPRPVSRGRFTLVPRLLEPCHAADRMGLRQLSSRRGSPARVAVRACRGRAG